MAEWNLSSVAEELVEKARANAQQVRTDGAPTGSVDLGIGGFGDRWIWGSEYRNISGSSDLWIGISEY